MQLAAAPHLPRGHLPASRFRIKMGFGNVMSGCLGVGAPRDAAAVQAFASEQPVPRLS